ncbi:MAG: hypothetical protein M1289_02515 [Patescibacteria group bacterium]|nr:hypothetical protein [Patescibacteria group bacterium]
MKTKLFKKTPANLFILLLALFTFCSMGIGRVNAQGMSLYFTDSNANPENSLELNPGQQVSLDLYLTTGTTNIDGYDMTIKAPNDLSIKAVSEDSGAQQFNDPLSGNANIDIAGNSLRLARITTDTQNGANIQGNLKLATITFMAGNSPASSSEAIILTGPVPNNSPCSPNLAPPCKFLRPNNRVPAVVSQSNTGSFEVVSSPALPYTIVSPNDTFLNFSLPLADMSPRVYRKTNPVTVCVFDHTYSIAKASQEFPDCRDALAEQTHNTIYVPGSITNDGTATFNMPSPYFDLGQMEKDGKTPIASGAYTIAVKPQGYLAYILTATISAQTLNTLPTPASPLIAGDINGDNSIDIMDYNILDTCGFGAINPQPVTPDCQAADLDNDDLVDGIDFNIWDRGIQSALNNP